MPNTFDAKATLTVSGRQYEIYRLDALQAKYDVARLPFSLKILLENLCATRTANQFAPRTSRRWHAGTRARSHPPRSPSRRRG